MIDVATAVRIGRIVGKSLAFLTAGGVLVTSVAWLAGAFETKIAPVEVTTPVRQLAGQPTDVVHDVTKSYIEEAVGTLKAASRSIISANLLATIDEIHVTAGDYVQAGDILVRLSARDLTARKLQAEQAVTAAKAHHSEAVQDYDRQAKLVEKRAVTPAMFEKTIRNLKVARANETRAEQALTEAEVLLSYATIRASKSGRIVDRLAEPGDTARPGEPILILYDATSLRLEAPVTEQLAVQLRVGQELTVFVDALGRELKAEIDEIVPQADAPSRSFLVKASLPRSTDLYEGMFGRLRIPAGTRRHLCLAAGAVQRVGQLEFVDVVLAGNVLQRRYIKTGRVGMPGRIEVLSGLAAGEKVVVQRRDDSDGGFAE
ncbi:efflux RND transporter periplasmic adaptor subunit [Pirellulales bacterium]|nr:efflux RND transporter periplasmic adaptor subunit [Pirellulales bacterium]